MTNPIVWCETCKQQRDCMKHLRADHPPTAAKNWMRSKCRAIRAMGGRKLYADCDLRYRAGFGIGGRASGQASSGD